MRRKLFIIAGIIAALFAGTVLWLSPPRFIQSWGLPEVARDLPPSNLEDAQQEFNRRVQERYTVGTKEQDLVLQLSKDGFTTYDNTSGKSAVVSRSSFPCMTKWSVNWKTDDSGTVTQINGSYFNNICL